MNVKPSSKAINMIGDEVIYTKGDRPGKKAIVVGVEKVHCVITRGDGSKWTAVRYQLRPTSGGNRFWTTAFPDQLAALPDQPQPSDTDKAAA
jgi:hypothetical protein